MRRLVVLAAALVAPVVLPVSPAYAAVNTICVGTPPAATCNTSVPTIAQAVAEAALDGLDSVIVLDDEQYAGPLAFAASGGEALTVQGSGPSTVITMPANATGQTYVSLQGVTLSDLTVKMAAADSENDFGIYAEQGSAIDAVVVDGTGTEEANGMHLRATTVTGSTVTMPTTAGGRGIYGEGGNTITDTTVTARVAFSGSMAAASVETLSRVTLTATARGVEIDSGTVDIDDSLIDLGASSGIGISADNPNNGTTPKAVNADHVTIVGGNGSSRGVLAGASAPGALQVSTVTVSNSIVRGPGTSFVASAGNNGSQGGPSTATLTVTHSAYESTGGTIAPVTGAGGVTLGTGNTTADPQFAGVGDYRPVAGSPAIDSGNPAGAGPLLDLQGSRRVQDGDADGIDRRDMGAFELADTTPPDTAITSGPSGPTRNEFPTFTFASDPGATFECQVDAAAYAPCPSPFGLSGLPNGPYTLRVRATDTAGNVDPTPAVRSFTVDTISPTTKLTKKPPKQLTKKKAKFAFTSNDPTATFRCAMDKIKKLKPCPSPFKVKVKTGRHTFFVQAVDPAGNTDATPAQYTFTRKKPRT